jgi:hypothetical protein
VADEIPAIARGQNRWDQDRVSAPRSPTSRHRRGVDKADWIRIDRATYDACLDRRDYRRGPRRRLRAMREAGQDERVRPEPLPKPLAQDKGEGRKAPKCACLLSDARPSASVDAIQPPRREGRIGAVARGVEEGPAMVHRRVLDAYAAKTVSCSVRRLTRGHSSSKCRALRGPGSCPEAGRRRTQSGSAKAPPTPA